MEQEGLLGGGDAEGDDFMFSMSSVAGAKSSPAPPAPPSSSTLDAAATAAAPSSAIPRKGAADATSRGAGVGRGLGSGTAADPASGEPPEETVEFDFEASPLADAAALVSPSPHGEATGKNTVQGGKQEGMTGARQGANEALPSPAAGSASGGAEALSGKSATAAAGSLEDELSQLEELERELGIMGVVDGVGGAAGSGDVGGGVNGATEGDAGKDDHFNVDNLDELEGYLESLAK